MSFHFHKQTHTQKYIHQTEKPIDVVLPTGAMGNIVGGYMAKKMGLPLRLMCAGVNANDITHRAFQNGEFHKSPKMIKTLSDAINIQLVRTACVRAYNIPIYSAIIKRAGTGIQCLLWVPSILSRI
jgi:hypothetical protein